MDKKQHSKSTASESSSSSTAYKPKKSSSTATTAAAVTVPTITTSRNAILPQSARRIIQNFLLVWLDANIDESKEDFQNSSKRLRRIVASITVFTDVEKCVNYLNEITKEKVFMIVSGSLGQKIVQDIEAMPQLESVYVFCGNQSYHEQWANKVPKIKGVCTKIERICNALEIDRQRCDQAMISISFNGIDALFMYTQFVKEALLEIEDDDAKSIKDLVEYCRLQTDIDEDETKKVQREYRDRTPIWWYTSPYFMYSMLNRALRQMDVDIILKMGFFIRNLHQHITELHHEQQSSKAAMPLKFQVFRGQGLSMEAFDKMKETEGGLMSFNNFLLTSRNREISFKNFARPAAFGANSVGILFVMSINTAICAASSTPFVNIKGVGFYSDKEEEILFSTHTIFRIDHIERIEDRSTDRLWQVNLTLTGNQDDDFNKLTASLREEFAWTTGWSRIGDILIAMSEFEKAEHLYKLLLERVSSDEKRSEYYFQLATVYKEMGENSKALSYYEKSLDIDQKTLSSNHPDFASTYNQIGLVYYNMSEYSKALLSYEQSLKIKKSVLPPNHPNLATSYNNIGLVYKNMSEYSKALSSYERSLEIRKVALPPNHLDLAASYNNIGMVYDDMGDYLKALSSYERSLEMRKIALPSNHPDLAYSYHNIGLVYQNMKEYSKALSYYVKALDIDQKALPSNHPDLASDYNNIGDVHSNMGAYSKALSYYEKAQEIWQKSLPSDHPHIALAKRNIEDLKKKM
ncbi:unnamed protein product [Rotaria sordida]|uniref:Protein O-GlcNAc transferase n=1 Tax=Rotaria sordida TaxID=392033 RepID=A0A813UVP9_9BILA|nr:unnamed protein product [Rotaria sordida]CAF0831457.1 unnamed protein product [Rotaria sordida]